jgi:hypothetical protein
MMRVITASCAVCGRPVPGVKLPLQGIVVCSVLCGELWDAKYPVPGPKSKKMPKGKRKEQQTLFDYVAEQLTKDGGERR